MAFGQNGRSMSARHVNADMAVDAGLRSYMLGIYNYMGLGLLVSAAVALLTASSPALLQAVHGTPLRWVVMLAPLGILMIMSFGFQKMSAGAMQALYWVLTVTMGLSLSYVLLLYTGGSVAKTFFATAAAFGGLSLYGYTTKKDLSGLGSFAIMGLIGLIVASVVNMFTGWAMLDFIISVAGVLIFSALIAYDTQRLKESYYDGMDTEMSKKLSLMGAVALYINFINLFQFLLMFLGNRE